MRVVAAKIVNVLNDESIEVQATAIAHYLLVCEKIPCETVLRQLDKPGAETVLRKLLDCESDFMGPVARSLGLDIISYISADKIQKSLDVKHLQTNAKSAMIDRIIPIIKQTMLHTHPQAIWVRFYCERRVILPYVNVVTIREHVYEAYISKTKRYRADAYSLIRMLESEWDADIIFCSELQIFLNNKLLFLSNFLKFMWCYGANRQIFDPITYDDFHVVCIYITYALLFLKTSNLTNMQEETHNPLIAYTGERPKVAMSKFKPHKVYTVEGNRAMQTVNRGSDFGSKSNFIEIVSKIELTDTPLTNIV